MKQFSSYAGAIALLLSTAATGALAQSATPVLPLAPQGGAVTQSATQGQAAPKVAENAHDPHQVICKHVEETGSRLGGSRQCRTREQWEENARGAEGMMLGLQNPGSAGSH